MISFPLFSELEARRDAMIAHFHKETEPQLIERLQQFGFRLQDPDDSTHMVLTEQATGNHYLLTIGRFAILIQFKHIKTGEIITICELSNLTLNAHNIMNILIQSIDSWLQYGVVYDYRLAQKI